MQGLLRTWRGHFRGQALDADADWTRTRTVCGLSTDMDCPLPVHGHGLDMDGDSQAGHGADIPRPFRVRFADTESFRKEGVGLAIGLKMK